MSRARKQLKIDNMYRHMADTAREIARLEAELNTIEEYA